MVGQFQFRFATLENENSRLKRLMDEGSSDQVVLSGHSRNIIQDPASAIIIDIDSVLSAIACMYKLMRANLGRFFQAI